MPYTVTGTATVPGFPSCPFSISGTGHIVDSDTLLIPYSGTTCIGPISGEETLRRPAHAGTRSLSRLRTKQRSRNRRLLRRQWRVPFTSALAGSR